MTEPLLSVSEVSVKYGQSVALTGVSLEVHEGEAVALLGANGAGKSSLANAIVGLVRLSEGTVKYGGRDISRLSPHRIARAGLLLVPEGRGTLRDLTVRENLRLGMLASSGRRTESFDRALNSALEIFPALANKLNRLAGSLSGGEQQMVVLARAVLGRPRVLILDEPSLGLAPLAVANTFEMLEVLVNQGMAVVVVEQNVATSLRLAQRGYVISNGKIALAGSSEELAADSRLAGLYLGGDVRLEKSA